MFGANLVFLLNFPAYLFVEESDHLVGEVIAKGEADMTGWLSCTVEMLMLKRMRWED